MAVEEMVPIPNDTEGRLRKQLYHKRRCWSKEVRRRIELKREHKRCEHDQLDASLKRADSMLDVIAESRAYEEGAEATKARMKEKLPEIVRNIGTRAPELVADAEVVMVEDEPTGAVTAGKVQGPHLGPGVLQKAVEDAILARSDTWFTKRDIMADIARAGLTTSEKSVEQTITVLARKVGLDKRRAGLHFEFRLALETQKPAPLPIPPQAPKVQRPQPIRHQDRPGPFEREQLAAQTFAAAVAATSDPLLREELPGTVEEPVMAQHDNGNVSKRVHQALFVLKSEKLLNELERTMMDLVRDAIKQARAEISKLVEEELSDG